MRTLTKKHIDSLKNAEEHAHGMPDNLGKRGYDDASHCTDRAVSSHKIPLRPPRRERRV